MRRHEDWYGSGYSSTLSLPRIEIEMSGQLHPQVNLSQSSYPLNQKVGVGVPSASGRKKISLSCWEFHVNYKKSAHSLFIILTELFIKQYSLQQNSTYPDVG
jgi:hypothetical protein